MDGATARRLLRQVFDAALGAAMPAARVATALPDLESLGSGRIVVIGAGKAAAAMARAVEIAYRSRLQQICGLVITRYGHAVACERIEIVEAAHPVPDTAGRDAARRMLAETVAGLAPDDLVICLLSGGGSALLSLPADGIPLAEMQELNRALLRSGATIAEINCVRKHLSAVKGGRLALACQPARLVTLLISDIPGDDPALVASGPTLPDATTCADALAVLERYDVAASPAIRDMLVSGRGETPKPGHPVFAQDGNRTAVRLIATPQAALEAAAAEAWRQGIPAHILSDAIEGEARDIGAMHAALAKQVARRRQPFAAPCLLLSGGETTVTVRGQGQGGRNVEFLLALAHHLDGHPAIHALAADTDGVDGSEEIAGAFVAPDTLLRAERLGLSLRQAQADNDGHGFFRTLGDSLVTGPTLTNVNDFRAILIL